MVRLLGDKGDERPRRAPDRRAAAALREAGRTRSELNGVGGDGSQLSVPGAKRPFLFDLPTFVTVKGGEYLFVPGLKALNGIIEQKF